MSKFTVDLCGADLTGAHIGDYTLNASRTYVGGNRIVNNFSGDAQNGTSHGGGQVPSGSTRHQSQFDIKAHKATMQGARIGDVKVDRSEVRVRGTCTTNNYSPGCGAQGVPDGTRPPVANESKPPHTGTFNIKAQNANMQGAQFGDETENRSKSVVLRKDITHNVSGNQYNRDQTAPRNAHVPASAPAANAWQPPKEASLQVGGNTPLQIAGGWYHWSWIPPAALAALDAGTGALASVVGRCCRALRVRLLAALAPAPHVCSSSPGL